MGDADLDERRGPALEPAKVPLVDGEVVRPLVDQRSGVVGEELLEAWSAEEGSHRRQARTAHGCRASTCPLRQFWRGHGDRGASEALTLIAASPDYTRLMLRPVRGVLAMLFGVFLAVLAYLVHEYANRLMNPILQGGQTQRVTYALMFATLLLAAVATFLLGFAGLVRTHTLRTAASD